MEKLLWITLLLFVFSPVYSLTLELYEEIGSNEQIIRLNKVGKLIPEKGDPLPTLFEDYSVIRLPKKPHFLSSAQLFTIIKNKYGIQINIIGKGIKIYPLYTVILDQEIAEKIKTQIYKTYPHLPENSIEIMYIKTPKFPKVPAGDLEYKILVPGGKIDLTKYVRVQIQENKKDLVNIGIPIKIIFRTPQWISKKEIQQGSVIKETDFKKKWISALKYPKELDEKHDNFFGKKISKRIKTGEILNSKYLF